MKLFVCLLSLACWNVALAESVEFSILDTSSGVITGNASGILTGSNSHNTPYGGTLIADIDFDRATERVSSILFTDGAVTNTDFEQRYFASGFGTIIIFIEDAVRRFDNSSSDKTIGYESVSDTVGELPLTGITLETYRGRGGSNLEPATNFSITPDIAMLDSGVAEISTIKSVMSTAEVDIWDITITMTFRDSESESESGATIVAAEAGTIIATGQIERETSYGLWARGEGIEDGLEEVENAAGIPNRLLHAFNLNSETAHISDLILNGSDSGENEVSITMPSSGLQREVVVEYSPDLMTPFQPLADSIPNMGILEEGQTETETIRLPSSPLGRGFIRLSVE